jgi:tyrosine-protein kinase Etk/Wzc
MKSEQPDPKLVEFRPTEARGARAVAVAPDPGSEDTPLATHLWTIFAGRKLILAILVAFLAAGVLYLAAATPMFRAAVTLQLEDRPRTIAGLEQLLFGENVPAETEMQILRSRALIRSVVQELGLDLQVSPLRFPIVGAAMARRHQGTDLAPAPFGLSRFAWGGERISIRRVEVSDDLVDVPLVLTALDGGRFRLATRSGDRLLDGEVGKVASGQAGRHRVELFVADLFAHPGTEFRIVKRFQDDVVDELVHELDVRERGKNTGILAMGLDGPDPAQTAAILNAISTGYVRQNVEHKSAEAAKTLEFLESQLPIVRANLEAATAAMNQFQVKKGTVDLSRETTSRLERSVEIERAFQELEMQRAELRQKFTDNHPALASLNEKAAQLRAERAALAAQMREIPAAEVDTARLQRDVRSASELYTTLLNKAQELRVVKSGTVGNVRIVDPATVAHRPDRPSPPIVLLLAGALGLAAGIAAVFVREALDQGAEDADEIEAGVGLPVYVTIPHSSHQAHLSGSSKAILAAVDPGDVAIEHVRSLRTSLQFALIEARNSVIAITGPTPGVGKSFLCLNLADVIATADRRVLLIDCDLRRGRLHQYCRTERHPGVSDVVSGTVEAANAVRPTNNPNLDIMPTGRIPPNPADLLSSKAFEALLAWAARRYAFVVIDTPPVLAVTDASIVARLAGVTLLVLRAGQHSIREIGMTVKRLAHHGVKVSGAVLNDVRAMRGRYGKSGRYQTYEYRSSSDS